MQNWSKPRTQIIDTAILALREGWYQTVAEASERLTKFHYRGVSPQIAEVILRRDIHQSYYQKYGGQSKRSDEITKKAATLQEEGWHFISDHRGRGGFWRHSSGIDINQAGGSWPDFETATLKTYQSQTRQFINRRS